MQLAWIVVDVLLGGTGYLILRLCGARRVDDAQACVLTGLGFWVLIGFGTGWLLRRSTG